MLLEMFQFIGMSALALTISALYFRDYAELEILAGIFWIAAGIGASDIVMYNVPSAVSAAVHYQLDAWIIYLLGGSGVYMIVHAISTMFTRNVEEEIEVGVPN
jgi:hypothetical protein